MELLRFTKGVILSLILLLFAITVHANEGVLPSNASFTNNDGTVLIDCTYDVRDDGQGVFLILPMPEGQELMDIASIQAFGAETELIILQYHPVEDHYVVEVAAAHLDGLLTVIAIVNDIIDQE